MVRKRDLTREKEKNVSDTHREADLHCLHGCDSHGSLTDTGTETAEEVLSRRQLAILINPRLQASRFIQKNNKKRISQRTNRL